MSAVLPVLFSFLPAITCALLLFFLLEGFTVRIFFCAVCAGLFALLPITVIQTFFPRSLSVPIKAFVLNGLIEETAKMLCLFFIPSKKIRVSLFFWAAVLAGLTLGSFETLVYVLNGHRHIVLRTFTAVLIHGSCAGLSSFFVYSLKNRPLAIFPFILAILIHGLYNFFAGFSGALFWLSPLCILFAANRCTAYLVRRQNSP